MHARRIRRIERAAARIAEGSFDEPLIDDGDDELAELAATFDRMRVQLRQLDTARKEFVANASHELRTPLFSLSGFLELMADEDLDEETRAGFLTTTREQVDRLTRLAANLLDLSRIDAGRLHVEREEVNLGEVVATLVEELGPIGELTGHVVTVDERGEVWALADEERVLQVARALAGNALAHTPRGSHVAIEAATTPDRRRVASVGRRAGNRSGASGARVRPVLPGRCRACIRQWARAGDRKGARAADGGGISVASEPGRTRFTVTLPAADEDDGVAVGRARRFHVKTATDAPGRLP